MRKTRCSSYRLASLLTGDCFALATSSSSYCPTFLAINQSAPFICRLTFTASQAPPIKRQLLGLDYLRGPPRSTLGLEMILLQYLFLHVICDYEIRSSVLYGPYHLFSPMSISPPVPITEEVVPQGQQPNMVKQHKTRQGKSPQTEAGQAFPYTTYPPSPPKRRIEKNEFSDSM
ncbi:hypothetical protein STEG23_033128, partial [Scotinomys teguina]